MTKVISFNPHDHEACTASALEKADAYCQKHALKFTPVRRQVLEILCSDHKALGAYEILKRLGPLGFKSQPPVVYRALEFLVAHRFVHKIEKLNAYVACMHHDTSHVPAFLICRNCETVAEAPNKEPSDLVAQIAKTNAFTVEKTVYEAEGRCVNCKEDMADDAR